RAHHVVGIGGAQRLRHDVADAQGFEHGAHRAAGDDAGTRRRRTHDDLARAMMAAGFMMEPTSVLQRHTNHGALGGIGSLADRFGHFAGLAVAKTHAAALIAHDNERGEAEPTPALHHFRHAVDVHQLVDEFAVALFTIAFALSWFTRHAKILFLRT